MQTCRKSQPVPRFWPRRSPVIRWPMPSIRPSFLMSMWISSPGCVALVADRSAGLGSRAPSRPSWWRRSTTTNGGDRTAELAGDRRAGQALAAQRARSRPRRPTQPGRAVVRPRGAIDQPGRTLIGVPVAPLAYGLGVMPKAAATEATLQPSARRWIISNRPCRVVRAFWWTSIRRLRVGVACVAATTFQLRPGWTTSIATTARAAPTVSPPHRGQGLQHPVRAGEGVSR